MTTPRAPEPGPEAPNPRALARLVSRVENDPRAAAEILAEVWARTGRARRVGVTGPPGVGKSTLVDQLIAVARGEGRTVAVVAVDPSSPFTHGAILGDRVRMLRHSGDRGVYIRSMAARTHLGGLAAATRDVADLLDASGFGVVLLETVGVGQSELDVMRVADTVAVVTAPGLGDAIQTLKAGILEIADVLVVNKADRPDAKETVMQLREMQRLAPRPAGWEVPVLETAARDGAGIPQLWAEIGRHQQHLGASGELAARRARRAEQEVLDLVERGLAADLRGRLQAEAALSRILAEAKAGAVDPYTAAKGILDRLLGGGRAGPQ